MIHLVRELLWWSLFPSAQDSCVVLRLTNCTFSWLFSIHLDTKLFLLIFHRLLFIWKEKKIFKKLFICLKYWLSSDVVQLVSSGQCRYLENGEMWEVGGGTGGYFRIKRCPESKPCTCVSCLDLFCNTARVNQVCAVASQRARQQLNVNLSDEQPERLWWDACSKRSS